MKYIALAIFLVSACSMPLTIHTTEGNIICNSDGSTDYPGHMGLATAENACVQEEWRRLDE